MPYPMKKKETTMKKTAMDMICQATILALCVMLSVFVLYGFAMVLYNLLP